MLVYVRFFFYLVDNFALLIEKFSIETSKDASERRRKRTETSDKKSTKESEVKEERKAAPGWYSSF